MKKIVLILIVATLSFASIHIVTTYQTAAEVAQRIAGSEGKVIALASSKYDPHFITPKPSLLAKLRRADLLIINGAGLEIGWLPPLLRSANNPKIQNGAKGFLDLSHYVNLIDVPTAVSRAFGDIHPEGNPHYMLDPHNIIPVAKAIADKLIELYPAKESLFKQNLEKFLQHWRAFLSDFDENMKRCKDKKVVQYHELFNYFLNRYGFQCYGTIEPLPGIAPSSKHTLKLITIMKKNGVKKILQDVYHERRTARFIASKAGAKVIILPHEVGALKEADTLENFYEVLGKRSCN